MKVRRSWRALGLSLMIAGMISAKDRAVRSSESFASMLAKAPYSVVVFYDASRENRKDPQKRDEIKGIESMLRALSKDPTYKEADLQFFRVDVSRKNLGVLASQYQVASFPTALLFLGREATGARLTGPLYRDPLRALINRTFKSQMETILKEKSEQRKRALERARIRAYNAAYWGPYWGWGGGYPYGWYGGYWGRPGFYFGW